MPNNRFVSIIHVPPPDCARCGRHTVFVNTPPQFRPEGAPAYSGVRTLCRRCYRIAKRTGPEELAKYPTLTELFGTRARCVIGPSKPGRHFVSIVYLPPPDCRRCDRPTFWPRTPLRFRPVGGRLYSTTRELCNPCYRELGTQDPDSLADYPVRYRRSVDTYAEYLELKSRYPTWTKREIATELIGISLAALDQAICRARRLERGERADPPRPEKDEVAA